MHHPQELHVGDVREGLRRFAAEGVRAQTCVTSPPYWGLRDYGHAGQIGLEPTPDEYVATMVDVFRLVRDVLTDDATLWLNLGDSYAGSWGAQSREHAGKHAPNVSALPANQVKAAAIRESGTGSLARTPGLKAKDLVGIPWRVAFALQADGWYLRQDIIWHKPNPMPESVRDRCTKAHEYLFLLTKRERYYYDAQAIAEPVDVEYLRSRWGGSLERTEPASAGDTISRSKPTGKARALGVGADGTRNRRSVWSITTEPCADAHFAVMPTALVEPCIAAGSRPGDTVLDPFMGSGTVAEVAQRLGRKWIGCELNPDYAALVTRRTAQRSIELA
jgi:DNA modification methylase